MFSLENAVILFQLFGCLFSACICDHSVDFVTDTQFTIFNTICDYNGWMDTRVCNKLGYPIGNCADANVKLLDSQDGITYSYNKFTLPICYTAKGVPKRCVTRSEGTYNVIEWRIINGICIPHMHKENILNNVDDDDE